MKMRYVSVVSLCILLGACGTTPEDRGVSGAGIGAGAGAIVGAVTGLSVVEGAVLGAVAGGLTGALTKEESVNLGEPAWKSAGKQPDAQTTTAYQSPASADKATVIGIQKGLQSLGYYPGPVDGINGPKTQKAIRQYQEEHGLLVDGEATTALMNHINNKTS
jgi:peptidoglycan hydrolase-like protein with peptidoglycan-binding domain